MVACTLQSTRVVCLEPRLRWSRTTQWKWVLPGGPRIHFVFGFEFSFGHYMLRNLLPSAKVFMIPTFICETPYGIITHRFENGALWHKSHLLSGGTLPGNKVHMLIHPPEVYQGNSTNSCTRLGNFVSVVKLAPGSCLCFTTHRDTKARGGNRSCLGGHL